MINGSSINEKVKISRLRAQTIIRTDGTMEINNSIAMDDYLSN